MSIYVSPASSIQNSDITVILFSPACTLTNRALHQAPCHRDRAISKHHSSRHQMPYLVPTGISHTTSRPSSKAHRPCAPPYSKVQTHIPPPMRPLISPASHRNTTLPASRTYLPVIPWPPGHLAYNKPSPPPILATAKHTLTHRRQSSVSRTPQAGSREKKPISNTHTHTQATPLPPARPRARTHTGPAQRAKCRGLRGRGRRVSVGSK